MTRTQPLLALALVVMVATICSASSTSPYTIRTRQQRALQKSKVNNRSYPPPKAFGASGSRTNGDGSKAVSGSGSARSGSSDAEWFEGDSRSGGSGGKGKGRRYLTERGLKSKGGVGRSGEAIDCEKGKKGGPSREYPSKNIMEDFRSNDDPGSKKVGFFEDSGSSRSGSGSKSSKGVGRSGVACSRDGDSDSKGRTSKRRTRGLKKSKGEGSGRSGGECAESGRSKAAKNKSGNKAASLPSRDYPDYYSENSQAGKGTGEAAKGEVVNKGAAAPKEGAAPKGAAAPKGGVGESATEPDSGDYYTTAAARASIETVPSGKKAGFSIGMMGVILMSLVAVKVGLNKKRNAAAKSLYADMDEYDDATFVYPTEDELLGPEFSDLDLNENRQRGPVEAKSSSFILEDLQDGMSTTTGSSFVSAPNPILFREVAPSPDIRRGRGCC